MQDDFFPFLACMEDAVLSGEELQVQQLAHKCAVHAGMVTEKLMACYEGEGHLCVAKCVTKHVSNIISSWL
jgi:hypothetical protein